MISDCPAISRGVEATVPMCPGIRQRDRGALKVGDLQFAFARPLDHVVIGSQKLGEAKLVRILDIRNQQSARAVFLRQVDSDAEIHALRVSIAMACRRSSAKPSLSCGNSSSARRMAQAIR